MRKKCLSRALAVMLAGIMTVGLLAGCGAEEKKEESKAPAASSSAPAASSTAAESSAAVEDYEVSYPMKGFEDVELRVYISGGQPLSTGTASYDDVPFWQGFEERTGIKCVWEAPVTGADATAAYNLMLTEEDLPHIVIGYHTTPSNMSELIDDGVALNINDYIEEYAPAYYDMMIANDDEYVQKNRKLVSIDGTMPAFISARSTAWGCTYVGPLVRQDWLDAQGLDTPKTIKDVEDVLMNFYENYNGAFFTTNQPHFFIGAFDAFAGKNTNYFLDEDGVIQYANVQPEWKDWLTTMNRWYVAGILDPNFATADAASIAQYAVEEKMGMSYNAISQQTKWLNEAKAAGIGAEWVGFANPTNVNGDILKFIQTEYSTADGDYGAYITTACDTEEELKAAMAWVNWAYTEEGQMYWNFGVEGESYEIVNGMPTFTDKLQKDERGIGQALRDWSGASAMPVGVQLEEFVRAKNNPACGESVDRWVTNQEASKYIVPTLPHTAEEITTVNDLNTALDTFVQEQALDFIMGARSLDEFDDFVKEVEKFNLAEILKIKNDAYQRFLSN